MSQDKTRQDKTRHDKTRQDKVIICLNNLAFDVHFSVRNALENAHFFISSLFHANTFKGVFAIK